MGGLDGCVGQGAVRRLPGRGTHESSEEHVDVVEARRGCALDALDALDVELSLICTFLRCFVVSIHRLYPQITHYTHKNK